MRLVLVAALAIAPLAAGCKGATSKLPEPKNPMTGEPTKEPVVLDENLKNVDPAFRQAYGDFSAQVDRIHEFSGSQEEIAIHSALVLFGDAIEKIPHAGGVDLRGAAHAVRGAHPNTAFGYTDPRQQMHAQERSFKAAADALNRLASGPYKDVPEVRAQVAQFNQAVKDYANPNELRAPAYRTAAVLDSGRDALRSVLVASADISRHQGQGSGMQHHGGAQQGSEQQGGAQGQ